MLVSRNHLIFRTQFLYIKRFLATNSELLPPTPSVKSIATNFFDTGLASDSKLGGTPREGTAPLDPPRVF